MCSFLKVCGRSVSSYEKSNQKFGSRYLSASFLLPNSNKAEFSYKFSEFVQQGSCISNSMIDIFGGYIIVSFLRGCHFLILRLYLARRIRNCAIKEFIFC